MTAPAAGAGSPAERRQHPRKNVIDSQLVTVGLPGEEAAHRRGILLDVSEGGLAVQPFVPLAPGTMSAIEMELPGASRFKGTGLVAWVGQGGRAGIRFIDVPPEAREQLRRFLGATPQQHEPITTPAPVADASQESDPELDLDGALELIAERARDITSASGVAVALGDSESMTCRVSSGNAPDVGAQLQRDAGLSGYCLRTGELVHCPDTLEDPRIDPAIAQQLNLRSILIVPVFADGQIAGLLEVLSAYPHAFEPRHIVRLQRVAQLLGGAIEDSRRAETVLQPDTAAAGVPHPERSEGWGCSAEGRDRGLPTDAASDESDRDVPDRLAPQVRGAEGGADLGEDAVHSAATAGQTEPLLEPGVEPMPRFLANDAPVSAAAVAAPALVPPPLPEPAPTPVSAAAVSEVPVAGQGHASALDAAPGNPASSTDCSAETGSAPSVKPVHGKKAKPSPATESFAASGPKPQALELTPVAVRPASKAPKPKQPGAPAPRAGAPSRNAHRPTHHIGPVYLTSTVGVGGEVVLGATITREGTIDNVRIVSGPRLLGNAAVSTVSQWRCQPYELNGAPIEVDTTITIHYAPAK